MAVALITLFVARGGVGYAAATIGSPLAGRDVTCCFGAARLFVARVAAAEAGCRGAGLDIPAQTTEDPFWRPAIRMGTRTETRNQSKEQTLFKRLRPTTSMVVSVVALFVALGGVGYAAATIGSAQIKNNSIRGKDIRNSTITGKDIRNSTITGKDVKNNSLTGADVNESKLGQVPSAARADTAGSAGSALSVATVRQIAPVTVTEGKTATLATYGPFTIKGDCAASGADTTATANITTSEANSALISYDSEQLFSPSDGDVSLQSATDAAGTGPTFSDYEAQVGAAAPSGRALSGPLHLYADADAGSSGACRFWGALTIAG